jgi:hypothetical protein
VNETFLKMFKSHLLKFNSKENDERISKIEQNLMSIYMMKMNVILKMSWLKKINSIMNWSTNKWRFKKNLESSSNKRRDATNKQKSKDFKKTNDFYIIQMSWSKLQFNLFELKAFAFAILFNDDSKKERLLIIIQKADKNNDKINNEISSQYFAFQDIFFEMKAHKLFEHDFHDHVIEILSNRDSFFDSIYNLSATKLKIVKNYIDEYMKKNFII